MKVLLKHAVVRALQLDSMVLVAVLASRPIKRRAVQLSALAYVLVLLFPVFSEADDLYMR
jgi:hypothetical protein